MRLTLGSDHAGFTLKGAVRAYLEKSGHEVIDVGTHSQASAHYPEYGAKVGRMIAAGEAELGILVCGTGIGIGLAANAIRGVRAVTCSETFSARMGRAHNHANVLSLGERVVGQGVALEMVQAFLDTEPEAGRHAERVEMLRALEAGSDSGRGG